MILQSLALTESGGSSFLADSVEVDAGKCTISLGTLGGSFMFTPAILIQQALVTPSDLLPVSEGSETSDAEGKGITIEYNKGSERVLKVKITASNDSKYLILNGCEYNPGTTTQPLYAYWGWRAKSLKLQRMENGRLSNQSLNADESYEFDPADYVFIENEDGSGLVIVSPGIMGRSSVDGAGDESFFFINGDPRSQQIEPGACYSFTLAAAWLPDGKDAPETARRLRALLGKEQ